MNCEIYQELFHYVAFPVFATSENGRVLYKNLACEKYLPEIYRSTSIKNKIYPEFPQESKPVRILCSSSYAGALAMMDGERIVFLCFSRLQRTDGTAVAEKILSVFGSDFSDLLVGLRRATALKKCNAVGAYSVDEDLLSLVQTDLTFWQHEKYLLLSVLNPIFHRLHESFETIGYEFSSNVERNFLEYLPVQLSIDNFLFLLGKLIFLVMKYSGTCQVKMILFSELSYSRHCLRLETMTNLKAVPQMQGSRALLLEELMPECASEIRLLDRIGLMNDSDFSIHIDALGTLAVTYYFPYREPDWHCVQSMDGFALPIWGNIENMINGIVAKIKDKDAFC